MPRTQTKTDETTAVEEVSVDTNKHDARLDRLLRDTDLDSEVVRAKAVEEGALHEADADGKIKPYTQEETDKAITLGFNRITSSKLADDTLSRYDMKDISSELEGSVNQLLNLGRQFDRPANPGGLFGFLTFWKNKVSDAIEDTTRRNKTILSQIDKTRDRLLQQADAVEQQMQNLKAMALADQESLKDIMHVIVYVNELINQVSLQDFENPEDIAAKNTYLNNLQTRLHRLFENYETQLTRIENAKLLYLMGRTLRVQVIDSANNTVDTIKSNLSMSLDMSVISKTNQMVGSVDAMSRDIQDRFAKEFETTTKQIASRMPGSSKQDIEAQSRNFAKARKQALDILEQKMATVRKDNDDWVAKHKDEMRRVDLKDIDKITDDHIQEMAN